MSKLLIALKAISLASSTATKIFGAVERSLEIIRNAEAEGRELSDAELASIEIALREEQSRFADNLADAVSKIPEEKS